MPGLIKQTDIDRARQEIGQRRAETLKRHAGELQTLNAEQAELDTLEKLIAAFCKKFKVEATPEAVVAAPPRPVERIVAKNEPEEAAAGKEAAVEKDKADEVATDQKDIAAAAPEPQPTQRWDRNQTNFERFSRAAAVGRF